MTKNVLPLIYHLICITAAVNKQFSLNFSSFYRNIILDMSSSFPKNNFVFSNVELSNFKFFTTCQIFSSFSATPPFLESLEFLGYSRVGKGTEKKTFHSFFFFFFILNSSHTQQSDLISCFYINSISCFDYSLVFLFVLMLKFIWNLLTNAGKRMLCTGMWRLLFMTYWTWQWIDWGFFFGR